MFTMLHHPFVDCLLGLLAEQTGSVGRVLYELQEMFNIFIMMPTSQGHHLSSKIPKLLGRV